MESKMRCAGFGLVSHGKRSVEIGAGLGEFRGSVFVSADDVLERDCQVRLYECVRGVCAYA